MEAIDPGNEHNLEAPFRGTNKDAKLQISINIIHGSKNPGTSTRAIDFVDFAPRPSEGPSPKHPAEVPTRVSSLGR